MYTNGQPGLNQPVADSHSCHTCTTCTGTAGWRRRERCHKAALRRACPASPPAAALWQPCCATGWLQVGQQLLQAAHLARQRTCDQRHLRAVQALPRLRRLRKQTAAKTAARAAATGACAASAHERVHCRRATHSGTGELQACGLPHRDVVVVLRDEGDCRARQLHQAQLITQQQQVGRLSSSSASRQRAQLVHQARLAQLNQPGTDARAGAAAAAAFRGVADARRSQVDPVPSCAHRMTPACGPRSVAAPGPAPYRGVP